MAEQDPTPDTPATTHMWLTDTPERLRVALQRLPQAYSQVTAFEPMPAGNGLVVVHVEVTL